MTYQPKRVQRRRTKGWTTPLCGCGCEKPARYVGRGTKWGNPWTVDGKVIKDAGHDRIVRLDSNAEALVIAVSWYAEAIANGWEGVPDSLQIRTELAGHDLMCWCPFGQPCHANVLLEIANRRSHDNPRH